MQATSEWIHRPLEREARSLRDTVEGGLDLDLVEADVERFGGVEAADDRVREAWELAAVFGLHGLGIPSHEHMFAHRSDGRCGGVAVPSAA
jgi:hypothetical protein